MTLFDAHIRLNQLGGVMSCIACTIQNHLPLASEFVAEFLVRVSKLYKYVAYFV